MCKRGQLAYYKSDEWVLLWSVERPYQGHGLAMFYIALELTLDDQENG